MKYISEIDDIIEHENNRLCAAFGHLSDSEHILSNLGKLMEENGELASEILIRVNYCRPAKRCDNREKLELEYADCLFTLLLLARRLGINPWDAIEKKFEILKTRSYKE